MRVLVIGGTAFMGPHIIRSVVAQGHEVLVFHRGQTEAVLPPGVQHVRSPLAAMPITSFPPDLIRFKPDVVLHMIAMGEADAQAAMQTFRGVARRIVVASSCDVYRAFARLRGEPGPLEPVPLTEDAPLRDDLYPYRTPETPPDDFGYSYDKILVERLIMSDPQLTGTVLRLPMVYGPGDKQHRLFSYVKRMEDDRPAILLDDRLAQWRNTRGYVENVAAAITLAVIDDRAAGRIYNVAEQNDLSETAWVQQIGQSMEWHGKIIALPEDQLPDQLRIDFNPLQDLVIDSSRIRRDLGYREHVPLDEAIQRTVAWERANPPDQIDPAQFDYPAEDAALATRA